MDFLDTILEHLDGPSLAVWGPTIMLILCGIGLPIPEDIILVTAGALGAKYNESIFHVAAITYFGIIGGDSIIFWIGHHFGDKLFNIKIVAKILHADRRQKVTELFHKYGVAVLFVGRFMPGLRAPIYFTAGSHNYSFLKFLLLDGAAAVISAPVFVGIGHWAWMKFGEDLTDNIGSVLGKAQTYFTLGALGVGIIVGAIIWKRSKSAKKEISGS